LSRSDQWVSKGFFGGCAGEDGRGGPRCGELETPKYMYIPSCKSWCSEVLPGRVRIATFFGCLASLVSIHELDVFYLIVDADIVLSM